MHLILFLVSFLLCCQSSLQSSSNSAKDEVLQWWKKMSVQKPVKCRLNPELLEDFHPVAQKYIHEPEAFLSVRICQNEIRNYKLKGLKINDGTIEGTGKITFLKGKDAQYQESLLETKEKVTYCLTQQTFNDIEVTEIIGTFENGLLTGPVKLKLRNGHVAIVDFVKGITRGLHRYWNDQGILMEIYYKDIMLKGFQWSMKNENYLVYSYNSLVKEEEEILTVVIPMNHTDEDPIMVGDYNSALTILENVHSAELEVGPKDFCLLNLTWKPKAKQDYKLFLPGQIKAPLVYQTQPNCKENGAVDKSTPEDQFKAWNSFMHGFGNYTNAIGLIIFHLKPELSPVTINEPFITNLSLGSGNFTSGFHNYANMSIWNGPVHQWKLQVFSLDKQGRLHGYVGLILLGSENLGKAGSPDFLDWSPKYFFVKFNHGVPNGLLFIGTWKGQAVITTIKDGVLHGPVYTYGLRAIMDIEKRGFKLGGPYGQNSNPNRLTAVPGTGFLGRFKNGKLEGNFWLGMLGKGFLHGKVDENGQITGDDIAYIYPDGTTALKGRFEKKFMKAARNVDVLSYQCDENGMLVVKDFTPPLSEHVFNYSPPTNESFGGGDLPLTVRDPYEVKTVMLAPSKIPNSGEGVFLVRDVPAYQFAALYSMFFYRIPDQHELYLESCTQNTSKSDDYRRLCKKYSLGVSSYQAIIDLPPEFDVNPLPNLGGKVNHHFRLNNSVFIEMEHPRWGLMQSLTPARDVKAGEELFAYYGYKSKEFPADFQWYWETLMEIEKQERLELLKEKELQKKEQSKLNKKNKKKTKGTKKSKKKDKSPGN